ncbi:TRAP transporter large permease [Prosthecomicrobium hirschii]|uniref:C4-dicarboxylate ABC transporter n=1 Tax=Prosthecodimorpha hirschii TaxID=665126 RepID=A0A0P6VLY8_9HYPH|nr:TRAP transporter large permease subunit [Prosthecomicrobium hirschii]KPL52262.1 C4-dicarboxylate ABC transporter [Prosthecomicrobium hirschii]MCW1843339.1 TRAP transporter large permease subunit [Prosthecomicrobium hirschii]TPQ50896.1 C4-dicarboxylate ABC transporter [Prosthecomicrobium hirschii]
MSKDWIIWAVTAWIVVFMLAGQAVATCLLGAGLLGVALWMGPAVLGGIVGQDTFYTASAYTLSIIPLYLLMAQLLLKGGVIVDLFRVGHRLAGYKRFPLGIATIVTGGLLGAVSGSGTASAAALATLAGPELQKVGYTRSFSVALTAISGSLSVIIPPSLLIMIYGSLTEVPIGHLFIGSIGPGLLCILVYIGCLYFLGEVEPGAIDGSRVELDEDPRQARRSVQAFTFVVVLMVVVFGGIYGGIVTVGEAGALGAFAAFVGMLVMGRVGPKQIAAALVDSVKVSAMLLMLLIGAQIFSRFMSFSRLPTELLEFAQPLVANPTVLVLVLMGGLFAAGMFMEEVTTIVLAVPLIEPMIGAAGIDTIWFGVMACFVISLGLLTPPVGLVAFSAATAARTPVGPVFRPCLVFSTFAAFIVVGAMMLFPGIATWLPSHLN